jgi:hypothetical protein
VKKRVRFSVRSIFVFTLVAALVICCSWPEINRRLLIRRIENGGGSVHYNSELPAVWNSERIQLIIDLPNEIPLESLSRSFENLERVGIGKAVSDRGLTGRILVDLEEAETVRKMMHQSLVRDTGRTTD